MSIAPEASQLVPVRGRVAVVTGGNKGIGLAIAQELADGGASVVITGRDQEALASATKQLGNLSEAVTCDVTDESAVRALFDSVKKKHGRLDFLINNAGSAHANLSVQEMPYEVWLGTMAANLNGLFLVTHYALPLMAAGGVIVNNISRAALQPFKGMSAYNSSKSGALSFSNSLRIELLERGIRVTALVPGAVGTDIWQQFWPDAPREKMISPRTVAQAVIHVLQMPPGATIEQLQIGPAAGVL